MKHLRNEDTLADLHEPTTEKKPKVEQSPLQEEFKEFFDAVKDCHRNNIRKFELTNLPLKDHCVQDDVVYQLGQAFRDTEIETLIVSVSYMVTATAAALVRGLRGSSVKNIYFKRCLLGEKPGNPLNSIMAFGYAFQGTAINTICLKNNGFEAEGMAIFLRELRGSIATTIDFTGNKITKCGIVGVIAALQGSQVTEINLSDLAKDKNANNDNDSSEEEDTSDSDQESVDEIDDLEDISDEVAAIIPHTSLLRVSLADKELNPRIFESNRKKHELPFYLWGLQFLPESKKAEHFNLSAEISAKAPAKSAAGILMHKDLPQDLRTEILSHFSMLQIADSRKRFETTCKEIAARKESNNNNNNNVRISNSR